MLPMKKSLPLVPLRRVRDLNPRYLSVCHVSNVVRSAWLRQLSNKTLAGLMRVTHENP